MKPEFMNAMTRGMNRAALKVQKHLPEILATVGVVGVGATVVMACKATTKLNPILEEARHNIDLVHAGVERGHVMTEDPETKQPVPVEYTVEDSKKDLTIYCTQAGLKVVKLYAPSIVVGAFSIGCLLGSNHILRKRNVALAAAYTAVDKGFKEYRGRVRERLGEAMDRELLFNVKAKEVEVETVDPETGAVTTEKVTVEMPEPPAFSPYTFVFSKDTSSYFERDPELNKFFLAQQQNYANDKLRARGHVYLNEVLDMLGIDRVRMGNIVGWIFDEKNGTGDNYIDFGILDLRNPDNCRFVSGQGNEVWLNFNVDGNILELMP